MYWEHDLCPELQLRSISFSCTWGRHRWTGSSTHQQRNVVLLQYQNFPLLLQNGEILLKDWHLHWEWWGIEGIQHWNHENIQHLHPNAAKQEAQERCRFSNTGTSYEKVKSKMQKFNSINARIPGSPWQTPKQKKRVHKLRNKIN
jgi:hypothetical protein